MIASARRWCLWVGLLGGLVACGHEAAGPEAWARGASASLRIGAEPVGRVERQWHGPPSCPDSVRDVYLADASPLDSLWLDWRDSVPDFPGRAPREPMGGTLLTPRGAGALVVRQLPLRACGADPVWGETRWLAGVAWRPAGVLTAAGYTFASGPVVLRDTLTFQRCRGRAHFRSGDGLAILAVGGCAFRAAPPLISGLLSLDPATPGGWTPQDQLRLVSLGRAAGGPDGRDTLVLQVELIRTEGVARSRRDTALLVLGRRAP